MASMINGHHLTRVISVLELVIHNGLDFDLERERERRGITGEERRETKTGGKAE